MKLLWAKIRVLLLKAFARLYLEVLIASVLIVLAIGYTWFLRQGFSQLRTQDRYNLLSSRTYADYLQAYLKDLEGLQTRFDQVNRDTLARLATLVPPEPDLPGLFVQMEALARQNGLVVTSVQFTAAESTAGAAAESSAVASEDAPYDAGGSAGSVESLVSKDQTSPPRAVTITLTLAHGAYGALKQFLSAVESNLRLLNISSVSFTSAEAGPYAVRLEAYYLPR